MMPSSKPSPDQSAASGVGPNVRAVTVVIALLVAGVLLGLIPAALGAIAIGRMGYALDSGAFVVVSLAASALGFGVTGLVFVRRWLDGLHVVGPDRRDVEWILGGAVGSVAIALGLQVVYVAIGGPSGSALVTDAIGSDPTFAAVYALVSLLVVAPGEELLFRGAMQERMQKAYRPRVATVGASLLFAAPHALNIAGVGVTGLFAALTIFVVSLIWGEAYHRTGNLVVPVLIHGLYNAGLALVAYLTVVGIL